LGGGVADRTERPVAPAELTVQLPQGVSAAVVARSGLGEVQVLGEQEGGFGSRTDTPSRAGRAGERGGVFGSRTRPPPEAGGARRRELDLRVGLGQVRVEQ